MNSHDCPVTGIKELFPVENCILCRVVNAALKYERAKHKLFAEIIYDLTWNLAAERKEIANDSRERFQIVVSWAEEFVRVHENTDWRSVDYMETIDDFYEEKYAALKH